MTTPDNPPKRRPGAPKGNRNAVKTGLHTAEMKDLRRRLRAWRHRADATIAEAHRVIRAEREARQDEARAASTAKGGLPPEAASARRGEGGSQKTPEIEKQLSCA